ncbi:N-acetylmuramoyl-L-alanine amidase CwlD [Effusibacillus dendaii]|uniref:N-acetylmuramoyl-L-alanine amidase CwlD n=1 Tax=Effusibacillus dendaii TaxID=2743772 RepID=A0A7I8DFG6_9BACL|nr:N-acetylmuramoyl-L-alanine amidase CwlD [Effusibacillus dendaii]BCJ87300.1 N-acetylmuramoyl-L-alanine amidase CwlD [Effusibacillus dendaii]
MEASKDWRKISIIAGTLAILLFFVNLIKSDIPITKLWTESASLSGYTIVVDAGHGGPDGGAVAADGTIEKTINLNIAKYLRDYLQQSGAYVIMTREDDRDLAKPETKGLSRRKAEDLRARLMKIKDNEADMFLSIHLNSNPSGGKGAQAFYDSDVPASKLLAQSIQAYFKQELDSKRDIEQQENLYLLRQAGVPSVLAEVGFLSNAQELELLKKSTYQKKIAYSLYQGVLDYFSNSENVR